MPAKDPDFHSLEVRSRMGTGRQSELFAEGAGRMWKACEGSEEKELWLSWGPCLALSRSP